jgi:hypothetical protein
LFALLGLKQDCYNAGKQFERYFYALPHVDQWFARLLTLEGGKPLIENK